MIFYQKKLTFGFNNKSIYFMKNKKHTYKVFLDDIRTPETAFSYMKKEIYSNNDSWTIVRNYNDFVELIKSIYYEYGVLPSLISFDHDLADEHYSPAMFDNPKKYNGYYENKFVEMTGYDCAKWLVDFCMENDIKLPDFMVHSMNPIGGENIMKYLNNYKKYEKKYAEKN